MLPRPLRRQFLIVFAALSLLLLADSSTARPPLIRDDYRVVLEDEWGRPLPEYFNRGDVFVLGRFGEKYQIRISNPTARRVEAVVSVDGRDAISGRRADYVTQRGYLIPAYGSVVVTGFRRSLDAVAAFRFTSPDDSYSARMGTPENVGIVGVAFFPEASLVRPYYRRPLDYTRRRRSSHRGWPEASTDSSRAPNAKRSRPAGEAQARDGAGRAAPRSYPGGPSNSEAYDDYDGDDRRSDSRLGTEYGETEQSSVVEVPFRRASASHPENVIRRRYDDRYGLLARGIDVDGGDSCWCEETPEPFPETRFAPPPP